MKNNKAFFTILIFFFSLSQKSFSQKNMLPGYIIQQNGDTLYGMIDYRNWKKNPKSIKFSKNNHKKLSELSPKDIKEFKVNDEMYVSAKVNTEISSEELKWLNYNSKLDLISDTVFLKILFKGDKSLYVYSFKTKNNFYIDNNSNFELLKYKKYFKTKNGNKGIAENKNYLGQLSVYLKGYPNINSKLKKTKYKQSDLYKLFKSYYKYFPTDLVYMKTKKSFYSDVGIKIGGSSTNMDISIESLNNLIQGRSLNFSGAIFYDLILPWYLQKWSFYNEISISSYKFEGVDDSFSGNVLNSEIGYTYLSLNNLVKYKYPIGALYIFLNAGISNGYAVKETFNLKEISKETGNVLSEEKILRDTRRYEQGFILGTGIKLKNFSLEFRFKQGNGMSSYEFLNTVTNRYFIFLGYSF